MVRVIPGEPKKMVENIKKGNWDHNPTCGWGSPSCMELVCMEVVGVITPFIAHMVPHFVGMLQRRKEARQLITLAWVILRFGGTK